jgi:hypothetical protein
MWDAERGRDRFIITQFFSSLLSSLYWLLVTTWRLGTEESEHFCRTINL